MYQVIARKYRPAQFSELISQEHVRTTLENAINQQRIAHGYILSGQRGTGKTTVARIIARCLNCEQGPTATPCGVCSSCTEIASGSSVDVIEIDAASNRGINEMRELRENVRYRPARDRYKVFIIDEAHQITSEAFNALLKTLEEPPEWVVFILCTTESHKIPVTITSRCQQFSFRSVNFGELVDRMRWICQQEGIQADDEVLGIIAQAGEGSVRDSLSALDQAIACCGNTLTAAEVRQLMGVFSLESLRAVSEALRDSEPKRVLEVVGELERNGRSLHHFCRELARYFRNLLVIRVSGGETRLVSASAAEQARLFEVAQWFSEEDLTRYLNLTLELYQDLQASLQPKLHLEIGLLRLVHAGRLRSIEQLLAGGPAALTGSAPKTADPASGPPPPVKSAESAPGPVRSAIPVAPTASAGAAPAPARSPAPIPAPSPTGGGDLQARLIETLQDMNRPFVIDSLEEASVTEGNGEVIITAAAGTCKALEFSQSDLAQAAQTVFGRAMRIRMIAGEAAMPSRTAAPARRSAAEEEVMERALADPAVQSFRDAFPGSEIRHVRNLKD